MLHLSFLYILGIYMPIFTRELFIMSFCLHLYSKQLRKRINSKTLKADIASEKKKNKNKKKQKKKQTKNIPLALSHCVGIFSDHNLF